MCYEGSLGFISCMCARVKSHVEKNLFSSKGGRGIRSAEDSEGNPGVHSAGNDGIQREGLTDIAGEVSFLFLTVSVIAPKVVQIWYVQLICFMFTKVLLHMEVSSTRFTVNMEREHSTHQCKVEQTCGDTYVFERFSGAMFSLIVSLAIPAREMSPERKDSELSDKTGSQKSWASHLCNVIG